jgi:hypothetical protein
MKGKRRKREKRGKRSKKDNRGTCKKRKIKVRYSKKK